MYKKYYDREDSSKWRYCVVSESCYHTDLGHFNTYGIQLTGGDCEKVLHDISIYEEIVSEMARLFNRCQLFPCHFQDVVEELLP